jgi:hypothetical protein
MALTACVHYQLSQKCELTLLDCPRKQYAFQLSRGMHTERPQTTPFLAFGDVTPPIPLRREVFVER